MTRTRFDILLLAPLTAFAAAFLLLPLAELVLVAGRGRSGLAAYAAIVTEARYLRSLLSTVALASATTVATLAIATVAAQFLASRRFAGRNLLVSMLTFPLAFPGVVVGFMVILLGGRLGLIGGASEALTGERIVFAYSMTGLFVGYVYFSIPRVILTVIAAVEKLDPALVEAARSLGAGPFAIQCDVVLPALTPALFAAGALCFATAMGAFGTAFTLAARIEVLPMVIYTEFTLAANMASAAALSLALGLLTWIVLTVARSLSGSAVAAAG
ncbi:ABC transporter permease [Microvirga roseola]|uniref:ABC transporter permease n=1 Tax=Microvirga roseola TaxID=2883126 RepID=UPI001E580508|nr:ABC transporter permease subunit [Microvirga roseola]